MEQTNKNIRPLRRFKKQETKEVLSEAEKQFLNLLADIVSRRVINQVEYEESSRLHKD